MKRETQDFFERQRKAKNVSVTRATVESYVKSVMPQAGLAYMLLPTEHGMMLRIRMSHRRMLQIRLNTRNYIKVLQQLMPAIETLIKTFDDIGSMNVRVGSYYYGTQWVEPEETIDNQY